MRMRQSISEIEEQFAEQAREERARRERMVRTAQRRAWARHRDRTHKHGTVRFLVLCLVLLGTAVLVTVAMFQALYVVMG
jgi:hypothetical protein